MADIKFSEFPKATTSKDSDEIAILQDGVNKMIASPILESKIINKTVSRVIDQGGASLNVINLKGVVPTYADLALITPTPELNDAYQVEADGLVYVYTESGFQADGDGFIVQPEPTGVVEEGNTQAVSGDEIYKFNTIDNVYNSVFVDIIVTWTGNWYWNDLPDTSKIVLAVRSDINNIKIGKYDSTSNSWIVRNVLIGTNIYNRQTNRNYKTTSGSVLTPIFNDFSIFTKNILELYPILTVFKDLNIERKTTLEIKELSIVYFSASTTNLQIIVNLNDAMNGANAAQSLVINVVLADHPDKSNVVLTAENDSVKIAFSCDFSNLSAYTSFNSQTLDKSLWGRVKSEVVNSQMLPSRFLKTTESFSPFFIKNNFSGALTKDYAQFFRDIMLIYPYDLTMFKYFFRVIRKNYTGDGEASKYQILLFRQPIADTGLINAIQIAASVKGTIDPSGVELITMTPYDAGLKSKFYVLVDWNNLPSTYNAVLTADNNQLNELAFNGGNGAIRSQLKIETFTDVVESRLDNVNLGVVNFKKSTFNADNIEDYMLSTDSAIPSSPLLTDLKYVNLGANIRLAGIDDENKYWFINSADNSIGYCSSVDEVISLSITTVRTFTKLPVLCKKLPSGEILVVTKGSFSESLKAEIWVSANGQTTWSNKMNFDNANCETGVINQWGCSIHGDRIVLSGYGKRYTSNEDPSEAPRYTDLNDKANYSIYYSFDGGVTWFNRLFNLGDYFPSNFKPYAHIHAVNYDPYWGEIMVTHGDMDAGIEGNNRVFRTINLKAWEKGQKDGNPVALQWTNEVTYKFGGVGAMQHTMLFGSDDIPNGVYRASKIDKSKCKVELAWNEDEWAFQRTLRNPDGSPDLSSDYGMWGGYTFHRRNNNQPMYITNLYFGGVHADDYKRNQILATYDGYKFFKVWTNDRDLVTAGNVVISNPHLYIDSDDNNNIFIQTKDARFLPQVSGKPVLTDDYTLIIAKGI